MKWKIMRYPFISFLFVSLIGCGVVSIPKYPLSPESTKIKNLETKYGEKDFESSLKACNKDIECLKEERNIILNELILLTDFYYQSYEGSLIAGKAKSNFGFGMASTALSLASAVSTVEDTKTIISSVASLTSSTRTEIDKNFYYEQTAQALIVKMRALRTKAKLSLVNGIALPYKDYSLEQGLGDFLQYYRAGTMANAVQSVYEDAAKQSAEAQQNIDRTQGAITRKALIDAEVVNEDDL